MTERRDHHFEDDDAFAERIARPLRAPQRAGDQFEDSLIDAIRADKELRAIVPRRTTVTSSAWWSAPTVRLSPIASVALAAGIAIVAALAARGTVVRAPAPATARAVV